MLDLYLQARSCSNARSHLQEYPSDVSNAHLDTTDGLAVVSHRFFFSNWRSSEAILSLRRVATTNAWSLPAVTRIKPGHIIQTSGTFLGPYLREVIVVFHWKYVYNLVIP